MAVVGTEVVGPKIGAELQRKAILAVLYALGGMLVYIAFRFEWIYGAAAVIAVFHDTIITIGLFSLFNKEISLTVVAALLTLVGYSMNDTIVTFDRIRENLKILRREEIGAADQQEREPDPEPNGADLGPDVADRSGSVHVRRPSAKRFRLRAGVWHYRWYLFVGFCRQSDPDLLA